MRQVRFRIFKSTFMGYELVFIVIMLILNQHLKQTFDIFKNRIWGT